MTDAQIRQLLSDGRDQLREVNRKPAWSRFVAGVATPADRRASVVALIDVTRASLVTLTTDFAARFQRARMTLAGWSSRFMDALSAGTVAAAMAATGAATLAPADLDNAVAAIEEQRRYQERFRDQLAVGALLLLAPRPLGALARSLRDVSPVVANRAGMYADSLWQAAQDVLRDNMRRSGYDEERRRLGEASRHCTVCPSLSRLGWQPIGSLPRIGESPCRSRCRCSWQMRDSRNPGNHVAPLAWA
jgi:hypothetical protein